MPPRDNSFDSASARQRCLRFRRRILDVSQQVSALHIGSAYSCTEIVDCIYYGLMRPNAGGGFSDTFLMSKGHGCMIQYVILEDLGILSRADLDAYCTPKGKLGVHPDYGNPGIVAATGSLGHGLSMAVGMALAERWLARYCDHIITTSENLRERAIRLEGIEPAKITAIYNDNIDLRKYDIEVDVPAKRAELGVPADAPLVGTVGRLCAQKGMDDFIQAAALVHREMPYVHFLVVGDGPLRSELEALTAELDLAACVHFAGYRQDVPEIMFALDLFATATHWEGLGIVNIEAMLARRPLVSTDVGPIPEVVEGYRGCILVPPQQPTAMARAILAMLSDLPSYTRWGEEGRRIARERFGVEKQTARTIQLYERLMDQQGRSPS